MASNIYIKNDIELTLETNANISGADIFQIRYQRPDKTIGYVTGTLTGTTQIVADISHDVLTQAGTWIFKSYVEYGSSSAADEKIYQGDPVSLEVRKRWQTKD